jgi:glucosamine-6-phosphate deaminase
VIEDPAKFYLEFALDIVTRIREPLEKKEKLVMIIPAGPIPQYETDARLIKKFKIPCHSVVDRSMVYDKIIKREAKK